MLRELTVEELECIIGGDVYEQWCTGVNVAGYGYEYCWDSEGCRSISSSTPVGSYTRKWCPDDSNGSSQGPSGGGGGGGPLWLTEY